MNSPIFRIIDDIYCMKNLMFYEKNTFKKLTYNLYFWFLNVSFLNNFFIISCHIIFCYPMEQITFIAMKGNLLKGSKRFNINRQVTVKAEAGCFNITKAWMILRLGGPLNALLCRRGYTVKMIVCLTNCQSVCLTVRRFGGLSVFLTYCWFIYFSVFLSFWLQTLWLCKPVSNQFLTQQLQVANEN